MADELVIRRGRADDSPLLAELDRQAAGGVIEYLFAGQVPGLGPVEALAQSMARGRYPHCYAATWVAQVGEEVVGAAQAYPSTHWGDAELMARHFPRERVEHLWPIMEAKVERSLYLDFLAVFPQWRGQGVGGRLLDQVAAEAADKGLESVSLIAWVDNEKALALYRRRGFKEVRHLEVAWHEQVPHQGGAYLMAMPLARAAG